jgi:Tfp pilus assembly protein PilF
MPEALKSRGKRPKAKVSAKRDVAVAAPGPLSGFQRITLKRLALLSALLVAVTFGVYSRTFDHPFVDYDDGTYVQYNPQVQHGLDWTAVKWAFTATYAANWHPLTWLSHTLDYSLYGADAGGHHVTSVAIHAVNVVLLFLLLLGATGYAGRSALVAALFALHPLNVESVAWVAERKNLLSTFFFFLALAAYAWFAKRPNVQRYLLIALLFALGLASKPMIITLPFVLLLLDFWPLQRIQELGPPSETLPIEQAPFLRLLIEKLPLMMLVPASAIITVIAQRRGGAVIPPGFISVWVRLWNAIHSYAEYIWKMFWPLDLAPFYPGKPLTFWPVAIAAVCLALISALVWHERDRRYPVACWLWYLGTLVPVIGVIQVGGQAMADRYTYIPLIGIFVMLVWGAADLLDSKSVSLRSRMAAAMVVLAVFAGLAWRQIGFWQSSLVLWTHTLAITQNNLIAEDNLGITLLKMGRKEEALPHFQHAAQINPYDATSHINLGADHIDHGRIPEAIAEYSAAAHVSNNRELLAIACQNLGGAYFKLGDYPKAREYYVKAMQANPAQTGAMNGLGQVEMAERVRAMRQSVEANPTEAGYLQLGQMEEDAHNLAAAQAAYQQALKINPKSAQARVALDALAVGNKTGK